MKLNGWLLAALAPLTLLVTRGAFGAQILVLGLALGIFFGTLSLGRGSSTAGDATTTSPGT